MDVNGIEALILDFLAEDAGMTAEEMRAELLAAGQQMPVDSLLLVEIIVRLEDELGCRLPEDPIMAKTMTSVSDFAAAVARVTVQPATSEVGATT